MELQTVQLTCTRLHTAVSCQLCWALSSRCGVEVGNMGITPIGQHPVVSHYAAGALTKAKASLGCISAVATAAHSGAWDPVNAPVGAAAHQENSSASSSSRARATVAPKRWMAAGLPVKSSDTGSYNAWSLLLPSGQGLSTSRVRSSSPTNASSPSSGKTDIARARTAQVWEPIPLPEPSLHQSPLTLLGALRDDLPTPKTLLWDENSRCFASVWPRLLDRSEAQSAFDVLLKHAPWEPIVSKTGQVTRETCWHVQGDCACDYTYGSSRIAASKMSASEFDTTMQGLLEIVCQKLCPWMPSEHWPNSANLNLYSCSDHVVGWHSDDESLFMGRHSDCPIISLSLGAQREFWVALMEGNDSVEPSLQSIIEVDLAHGDVLTMEGLCQKHCVHFIPSGRKAALLPLCPSATEESVVRINVTWRWIRNHKVKCPLHTSETPCLGNPFQDDGPHRPPESLASGFYVCHWAKGRTTSWCLCSRCRHGAWHGGRLCVQAGRAWLCRLCSMQASSTAAESSDTVPQLAPPSQSAWSEGAGSLGESGGRHTRTTNFSVTQPAKAEARSCYGPRAPIGATSWYNFTVWPRQASAEEEDETKKESWAPCHRSTPDVLVRPSFHNASSSQPKRREPLVAIGAKPPTSSQVVSRGRSYYR